MIALLDLYAGTNIRAGALEFLYELMKERSPEVNISHKELPSFERHRGFVSSRPYRFWYLLAADPQPPRDDGFGGKIAFEPVWVGYISATHRNEIGVILRKAYRGRGYGPEAIVEFVRLHRPNPPLDGIESGRWLANIAPENEHSRHIFQKLGFRKIQETYALEEGHTHGDEKDRSAPA